MTYIFYNNYIIVLFIFFHVGICLSDSSKLDDMVDKKLPFLSCDENKKNIFLKKKIIKLLFYIANHSKNLDLKKKRIKLHRLCKEITGPRGKRGVRGRRGKKGLRGNTGCTGMQGIQGNIGCTGAQ